MNFNDRQLSFIITFFTMSIVVLVIFNIHLSGMKEPEYLFEIALDELEEELSIPIEEEQPRNELVKTHIAYNEQAKSRFEEELESFKTLDELIEEGKETDSEDQENPDDESNESSEDELNISENKYLTSTRGAGKVNADAKVKKRTLDSDGDNSSEEIVKNNVANQHTSISYSLKDRMHRRLPNPIYTCASSGKIVVNIRVDNKGNVLAADFNQASSTTKNGCLIDNAIAYALKSKFQNSAKKEQIGTITYLFQQD